MSAVENDLDLETSPSVPGGGPAPRWRARRVPSLVFRGWLLLLVLALGMLAAVILAWVRHGVSDVGIGLFVALTITLPLLLAGIGVAVGAANDSRVDDDVRVYGLGIRSTLDTDGADRPVTFDGRPVGTVSRLGRRPGRSRKDRREGRTVAVGDRERWLEQRGTRFELSEGRDVVATATAAPHGPLRDWEIDVDGRLLRLRTRVDRHPPRRTLLDDLGRAWRADVGKHSITARLPEELTPGGAAFVLTVLAAIRDTVEAVPGGSGGSGGGVDLADDGWTWD